MNKITDSFCGYISIADDTFTYNVSNHIVTLLPIQIKQHKKYEVFDQKYSRDIDLPEYIFGVTDTNHRIAMLRNGKFSGSFLGLNSSIQFSTPIIIKSAGNMSGFYDELTEDWSKFHAITFYGGNINALYNPKIAVTPSTFDEYTKKNIDGAREIKIRPWDDYTHSIGFMIDGEKATFTVSVSQSGDTSNSENMGYSLGELNSFIRISFENAQGLGKIEKYYGIAKALVAILTTQNNIFFEVYLSQRNSDNQYFKTGICKIFDHYENYSTRTWHRVIPIHSIISVIPQLTEKLSNNEVAPLLALLPEDNRRANQISITNVQDLITALEVAYDWSRKSTGKDPLIEKLKAKIKETINEFIQTHDEIDVYKDTTINSAFKYLDYTLKQKILTMFDENCDAVNAIISKWSLPPVNEANVGSFINLRNRKTHGGAIEWNGSENLYTSFLALKYVCLFRYIGMPYEAIKPILLKIF